MASADICIIDGPSPLGFKKPSQEDEDDVEEAEFSFERRNSRSSHPDSDEDEVGCLRPRLPKRSYSREEWERSMALVQRLQEQEEQNRIAQEEMDISLAIRLMDESKMRMDESNVRRQEQRDIELAQQLLDESKTREQRDLELARALMDESRQRHQHQEMSDIELARSLLDQSQQRNERRLRMGPLPLEQLLQPCQKQAVKYVKDRAREMHDNALPTLMVRVCDMGFTTENLQTCLEYIRDDAPIVIHVSEAALPKIVRDTHYRNLFEVHTSGGCKDKSKRQRWESTMFGNCYDENCAATDRPKYGALNVTGDIAGVRSAYRYGNCYMTLHEHVRQRATFFDKDTGGFVSERTLATNHHYAHILNQYNDYDLQAAMNVACNSRIKGAASWCNVYKEVQIHGPLCLETDIQALTLPGREADATPEFRHCVLEFQQKTGCNILWQMDLLEPAFE